MEAQRSHLQIVAELTGKFHWNQTLLQCICWIRMKSAGCLIVGPYTQLTIAQTGDEISALRKTSHTCEVDVTPNDARLDFLTALQLYTRIGRRVCDDTQLTISTAEHNSEVILIIRLQKLEKRRKVGPNAKLDVGNIVQILIALQFPLFLVLLGLGMGRIESIIVALNTHENTSGSIIPEYNTPVNVAHTHHRTCWMHCKRIHSLASIKFNNLLCI
mmetsp:Transcript_2260/g.7176  ORF Transcript_2260/g.7176 Transcript_2260/m.7176 type:complete len:216 (+) Transcript_2260:584-1231(+)